MESPRLHFIQVPESDIGMHFGVLLDKQEGSDVIINVAGEKFHAHKLVLAARSPVFHSQFFEEFNGERNEIVLADMEPKVFKAMLHFIYRDTLVEDDLHTPHSSDYSLSDVLIVKLLAAANKYGLGRLQLLCEAYLCREISVSSVANILVLADQHHAMELKTSCLKFIAENLSAVMRSSGFEFLKDNCPSLRSDLLKMIAGCEEEFSSSGKSRSIWAQLSDSEDSSGKSRRVRPWTDTG